jgi:hypothetical protein
MSGSAGDWDRQTPPDLQYDVIRGLKKNQPMFLEHKN